MHNGFLIAFFVSAAGTLWFGARASSKLSEEGEAKVGRVFVLGRLAGRQYFTPRGWRDRNLCLLCQALGLACALGWVLTAPGR